MASAGGGAHALRLAVAVGVGEAPLVVVRIGEQAIVLRLPAGFLDALLEVVRPLLQLVEVGCHGAGVPGPAGWQPAA